MEEGDVERGHVDIDHTVKRILTKNRSMQHRGSIYMVPKVYRDLSPRSYTPQMVSIGPLHHEDVHLKGFEGQKATYLHNLLDNLLKSLDSTPEQILKECVTKVSDSIDQIRACYIGMPAYRDSELVEMMVTDACFILSFLYDLGPVDKSLAINICLDMVLIENQIPFFVLQDIYECTYSKLRPILPLAKLIFIIQNICNIFERDLVMDNSSISSTDHDHILGFIHKSYQNPEKDSATLLKYTKAHSVVELDRSGVRFGEKLDAEWPMAMELKFPSFLRSPLSWCKPTLKMPVICIDDSTEVVVRNLIIYEHSSQVQTCITSYMHALDKLIDIPEDVTKLVKSHVLVNGLGSDEKAANLINSMLKEVLIKDFYYQVEWKQMDKYYNAKWPKSIAELRRNYFSSPWSIIALIAGFVLFVLTVIQTVYGVKAACISGC